MVDDTMQGIQNRGNTTCDFLKRRFSNLRPTAAAAATTEGAAAAEAAAAI